MSQDFHFKQFTIRQRLSAMKVGTDGVLLGAWTKAQSPTQVLDIGTGTGLIALMLAQRYSNARIHAVEIDHEACQEAQFNFDAAPWSDRLELFQTDLLNWKAPIQYDLIVTNPPYFKDGLTSPKGNRTKARHQKSLKLESLFQFAFEWSTDAGQFDLILPFDLSDQVNELAKQIGWYMHQQLKVFSFPEAKAPKRVLWSFRKTATPSGESHLILHESEQEKSPKGQRRYSQAFIELTHDFYLKH